MSNNKRISIIIPIYNVEKYLRGCLDDIINYSSENDEIILVNDGSTDACLNICSEYSSKQKNIKIVNKINGGLSSARNAGIEISQGKYVVFIDPDDRLHKDYFNVLFNVAQAHKCDLVVSGYETVPENKKILPGYELNTVLNGIDFVLSSKNIHTRNDLCFVWRNIYKLDIIKNNKIRFNEEVFIGEDVIFNLEFMMKCKRAYAIDKQMYYYTVNNPNSLMRVNYKPKLESSLIIQYNIRKKLSEQYGLLKNEEYKIDMANYYLKNVYSMIIKNINQGQQNNIKSDIKRILNYDMFRDNTRILGFSYKCENIKEYIYYLAIKFKIYSLIFRIYERKQIMKEKISIKIKTKIYAFYFYGKDNIISLIKGTPKILNSEETVYKIIKDKCSVVRFGDGEFKLLEQYQDLIFQKRSDKLSNRLKEIITSDEKDLIVCIPKAFSKQDLSNKTNESYSFWKKHIATYRLDWYKYLNMNKTYYNASFTRNYIALKDKSNCDKFFQMVKMIWDKRDILIVEGKFSRIGVGNTLFDNAKSVSRIIAPAENAFDKYDNLLEIVGKQNKHKLVLIALGPTATVLAYDLHKLGFQAIDIGHLDVEFEWYLKNVTVKTKLENKYVIEANNIIKQDDFYNQEYENQIIESIN